MTDAKEHPSTSLFRDYIRINTMQPNPDYPACIKFLRGVADSMGLQCKVWMLFGQNKLAKLCRYNGGPHPPTTEVYDSNPPRV